MIRSIAKYKNGRWKKNDKYDDPWLQYKKKKKGWSVTNKQ